MTIFNHPIVTSMSFTNLFEIQESDINTLLAFWNLASLPSFYSFPGCVPALAWSDAIIEYFRLGDFNNRTASSHGLGNIWGQGAGRVASPEVTLFGF